MIVPIHRAYFDDVVVYADTLGLFTGTGEGDFKKVLDELGAFRHDMRLLLYPGVTPYSFGYVVETNVDGRWESIRAGEIALPAPITSTAPTTPSAGRSARCNCKRATSLSSARTFFGAASSARSFGFSHERHFDQQHPQPSFCCSPRRRTRHDSKLA
jgi:hypothetical protein